MDDTKPVTRADLAELETRLRNDALAAVERHVDALETTLRKSMADTLEGHTQLLETLRDGVQEIRSFMREASERRAARATESDSDEAPELGMPIRRRRGQEPTRLERARGVLYAVYELPVERMPVDEAGKAQLDDDVRKLEEYVAGTVELGDDAGDDARELDAAIKRVARLVAPPKEARTGRSRKFIQASGPRGARRFF